MSMSQPITFAEAHKQAQKSPGVTLFTVSIVTPDGQHVTRAYTSHEEVYPQGGLKPKGNPDPHAPSSYQPNRDAIIRTFAEHELILALGGSAAINVPVVVDGEFLGAINFFNDESVYDESSIGAAEEIAHDLIPAIQLFRKSQ